VFRKKLLLSAAAVCAFASANTASAKISVFTGVKVEGLLGKLLIYDKTEIPAYNFSKTFSGGEHYNGQDLTGTVEVKVPAVLQVTENPVSDQYRHIPACIGGVVFGARVPVGPMLLEGSVSIGTQFGSSKWKENALSPFIRSFHSNLSSYDVNNLVAIEKDPYQELFNYEVSTRQQFTGEVSLAVGCNVPGTDGRFAVFLEGGVGFLRLRQNVTVGGSDMAYSVGAYDAFMRPTAVVQNAYADKASGSPEQKLRARNMAISDMLYFGYNIKSIPGVDWVQYDNSNPGSFAGDLFYHIIDNGDTSDKLIIPTALGGDPELTATKTLLTGHAGLRLEFRCRGGGFIAVYGGLKWHKGLGYIEHRASIKTPTAGTFIPCWTAELGKVWNQFITNAVDGLNAAKISDSSKGTKYDALITAVKAPDLQQKVVDFANVEFGAVAGGLEIGEIVYNVKAYEKFAVRVGVTLGIHF
jgi:hypothetical protein